MNTPQEREEPERREGLGGRVRRFVDTELSRVLDNEDAKPPPAATNEPREREVDTSGHDIPRPGAVRQPTPPQETPPSLTTPHPTPIPDSGVRAPEAQDLSRSREETTPDAIAKRVGLLRNPAALRDEWQRVQVTFVDDPHHAVQEASRLVERTLREIQRNVTDSQNSDSTSTEDLRISFQRYREFFHRLLSA